jgi:hypothetical protein
MDCKLTRSLFEKGEFRSQQNKTKWGKIPANEKLVICSVLILENYP